MELEMLKKQWTELNNRLTTVETLNSRAVKEIVKLRTSSSIEKLHRRNWIMFSATLFVVIIVMVGILNNPEITSVMNPNSTTTLLIFLLLTLIVFLYEVTLASKISITDATSKIMENMMKYKKMVIYHRLISAPITALIGGLIIFFEREWIIEKGRLILAILLFIVYCLIVYLKYRSLKREQDSMIQEIESNLNELNEMK